MSVVVVIGVVVVVGVWLGLAWRGLVEARGAAERSWEGIVARLRERQALVPALVAVVEAETGDEPLTLKQLVEAKERAVSASTPWEHAEAERYLASSLAAVGALAERHPGLGAGAAFVDLQARLIVCEDAIGAARRVHNADVRLYRARRSRLPGALLKRLGEFDDRTYFELDHTRDRGTAALALA